MLLRPLLDERRATLRHWLNGRGLSWIEDPANADPRFGRSRARQALAAGATAPATSSEPVEDAARLFADDDGRLVATNELMLMNIDYATRRSAPWPAWAMQRIEAMAAAHSTLPRPEQAGSLIGLRNA